MTAHRAFQFCKQYKRTTEFRRLCEIIRNHLANHNKYRDQRDRPDLSAPESLQLYLDTRFEQLKVATELQLWQEAFRSVEDIYGLMCIVKKTPKASFLVIYYAKLTRIFWISSSHIYHAFSWLKLFALQKSFNKNLTQKDLQLIASSVVLAALSVPPYDRSHGASHMELENQKERNLRVANLIGFIVDLRSETREVLSRSSLLSKVVSKSVMSCVTQEVRDLYHILEHEFSPLDLALKVQPLLMKISKLGGKLSSASSVPEIRLSEYIPSLEKLATLRLLQQVSRVYQVMKIETLTGMIPFFDFSVVEKISVDAVKHNFISMRVDHRKGAVLFGSQGLESEGIRDHLSVFAESLTKARSMVIPPTMKALKHGETLTSLTETVDKEHKRLLARKSIIEKRKEEQERQLLEMEREEESRRLKQQKITEEAERKRLAAEYAQRRNQRILKEIEERELEEAQQLLKEAGKRGKKKGKKPIMEGEKITKQTLMEMALNEQLKERQEMEKKLQKLAKTLDHLERAKREEASPLVEAAFQQRLVEEKAQHEHFQQLEIEQSRQRHAGDLEKKKRLSRVMKDKETFQQRVFSKREAEYKKMKKEQEDRINQIIQSRQLERETRRKMICYLKIEEERQKKLRAEEEARQREEAERRKKEEAERRAKLDEIAEKQRQRERELEEKERQRREEVLRGTPASLSPIRPTTESPSSPRSSKPGLVTATATASSPGKYVPRHLRERITGGPQSPPSPEHDRWGRQDDRQSTDRWRSSTFGGGGAARSTWSSSRR